MRTDLVRQPLPSPAMSPAAIPVWPVQFEQVLAEAATAAAPTKKRKSSLDANDHLLIVEMQDLIKGGMNPWVAADQLAPKAGGSDHGDSRTQRLLGKWKGQYPETATELGLSLTKPR
jgi:hypothetical protein